MGSQKTMGVVLAKAHVVSHPRRPCVKRRFVGVIKQGADCEEETMQDHSSEHEA